MITIHQYGQKAHIRWDFRLGPTSSFEGWVPNISTEMENWLENATSIEWIWEESHVDNAVIYKIGAYIDLEDLVIFKLKYEI